MLILLKFSTAKTKPRNTLQGVFFFLMVLLLFLSNRMLEIQTKMSERALELLNFPVGSSKLILDIGCGSGLSGKVLEKHGHFWIGLDISRSMLGKPWIFFFSSSFHHKT
eukprot:TRINITY_DN495_c0_g1_i12.p1 TRINITY_DN495_c0_g1~~TRINITY_DN495_c0_g1_i12.p1  ORF type:complete len:109 (-),score=15.62 TRINITY_DN495_c0_g1_i12:19-345(-)